MASGAHVPPNARVAAGLVLLYPSTSDSDTVRLVLTVRAGELGQHADQVSLPGGSVDPGEGVQEAALRESSEEIGVDPTLVRVVGVLSRLYIPVSDFVLHPVVGMAHSRPAFQPSTEEVARILEVPLEDIDDRRSTQGLSLAEPTADPGAVFRARW